MFFGGYWLVFLFVVFCVFLGCCFFGIVGFILLFNINIIIIIYYFTFIVFFLFFGGWGFLIGNVSPCLIYPLPYVRQLERVIKQNISFLHHTIKRFDQMKNLH